MRRNRTFAVVAVGWFTLTMLFPYPEADALEESIQDVSTLNDEAPASLKVERFFWMGADIGVAITGRVGDPVPFPVPSARFDVGRGELRGSLFLAANWKAGINFLHFFNVEGLFVVGSAGRRGHATRLAALQIGGGAFMCPLDEYELVSPTFVVGGSFGRMATPQADRSRFRIAIEPRFRLTVMFDTGGDVDRLVAFEVALCIGGSRMDLPSDP